MFKYIILSFLVIPFLLNSCEKKPEVIEVASLKELSKFLSKDYVNVKLNLGKYHITDTELSQDIILKKHKDGKPEIDHPILSMLNFSGNNSNYISDDVVITIDTELHKALGQNHVFEVFVSGNNNTIEGLEVRGQGHEVPTRGAIMIPVMGDGNTILNNTLYIQGSYP